MAKKDELFENKNNETSAVSDDKSLDVKDLDELQEDFSSMFNDDIEETDLEEEASESFSKSSLLLGRYSRFHDIVEEKKAKKIKLPWGKKAKEDTVDEIKDETPEIQEEKEENPEKVKEKDAKKPVFSWGKKSKEDTLEEKTDDVKEETSAETETIEENDEVLLEEVVEDVPLAEETVEEVIEELPPFEEETVEEVIEELPPFEEETVEEAVEELPPFEEETVEEVVEEIPPFEEETVEEAVEELPPFEEETVDEVVKELPTFEEEKAEEEIELLPPFQVGEVPVTIPIIAEEKQEESKPAKKKKVKEPKVKKEKAETEGAEALTRKDHFTFILALVALVLAITFICVKFFPVNDNNQLPENEVEVGEKLSEIQVVRQGTEQKYIQSDAKNVYYSISSENQAMYYEYKNGVMNPVQANGTVKAQVQMDKSKLDVSVDYVEMNDEIFGITIYRSEDNPGSTIHNVITFKLVDLPSEYKADGKALLLAVANSESSSRRYNLWTDSFIVDLNTGATERFLTADKNSDSYSVAYSVLTNSAYTTDAEMIPFFTTREYGDGSGKKDLFVKNGTNEALFATDVYGEYIYSDKDVTAYLKATETGFNVVKKEDTKEEKIVFSLYGNFSTDYLYHKEYILDKTNGNFYNVKTGENVALAGYGMSNAEMMSVSDDGRYLVVLGMVNSVADYQVHIFDLKKNDYAKYEELNFSQHYNLTFVDDAKVMYEVVDPNQGYEYVVLDVSKAF